MRVGALHDWPEFVHIPAMSREITASKSASSRMMLADLPPSSCATRFTVGAAARATSMPARVEPVNDTMSMSGCADERRADVDAVAVDEVEHALGYAGLVHDLREQDRVQRRDFGRLEHHRAARRERGGHLAGDLVQRPVPRRDHSARRRRARGRSAWCPSRARIRSRRARHARSRGEPRPAAACAAWRQPQRCADFLADDVGELFHAARVHADDAVEQREALFPARQRERLERGLGRGDRGVDVVGAAHRNRRDRLLRWPD